VAETRGLGTYLAIQGVAAAGSFLLPDPVGAALRLAVAAAGIGTLVAAVLLRRPRRPAGWWLIALSACLTYAAALAIVVKYGPGGGQLLASLSKLAVVVVALLSLAVGLAVLGWRSPGGRWDALDTAIAATGAFLLTWVFYIDPNLARSASNFATVVAFAVPACSLLVFGMAVKLAFCGALSTWSGRILLLATAAGLGTAVSVVGPIGAPAVPISLPIRATWLAQAILFGAAGLAPGFTSVFGQERRPPAMELPLERLALFVLLALVAPLNVAIGYKQAGTPGPALAAIIVPPATGTVILLILVTRLALVARVARRRAEELAERSASLATALARQDELQGELAYRALHDPLTGLANRDALAERIESARDSSGGTEKVTSRGQALIMVDLDGFKGVNDTLGHSAGDQVLIDVSRRLTNVLRDVAVVARLGGDEFAALLENTPGDRARSAAEATREALRAPYAVDGREIVLSASVGLLVIEPGAPPTRFADGLRETDRALYAAKAAGGNRVIETGAGLAAG
jgi:diguanylate cyclase (GGDEF)-like protein